MSERAKIKDAEIKRVYHSIVTSCQKCRGTGYNVKENVKIEIAASEKDGFRYSDEAVLEIKKARKKLYMKRHDENPQNSSYGLCRCYIDYEKLKGLLVSDIPLKFNKLDYSVILPRDVVVEKEMDKKPLGEFVETYVRKFKDLKKNSVGINLFGKIGTGKTFIAQLLGAQILEKRYSVHYIPYFSLAKMMNSFDDTSLLREILDVDLLIIDEIGNEHPSRRGFSGEIAHAVQKRIQFRRVTLFGFNGAPTEAEIIDSYGGAFFSVMDERNINLKFTKKAIPKSNRKKFIRKVFD